MFAKLAGLVENASVPSTTSIYIPAESNIEFKLSEIVNSLELPSKNNFIFKLGYWQNLSVDRLSGSGNFYLIETYEVEIEMVQASTSKMTLTPLPADCKPLSRCPSAMPAAEDPTLDMNVLHTCTLCKFCDADDTVCPNTPVALKTIWNNNRAMFAPTSSPDRRIGNVVKLKVEYTINLTFGKDALFRLYIPKDLT